LSQLPLNATKSNLSKINNSVVHAAAADDDDGDGDGDGDDDAF
jgi:hypothetical protein